MTVTPKHRDARRLALDSAAALIRAHLSVGGVLPQGFDQAQTYIDGPAYAAIAAELEQLAASLETRAAALASVELAR